jgi:hypothetical protein
VLSLTSTPEITTTPGGVCAPLVLNGCAINIGPFQIGEFGGVVRFRIHGSCFGKAWNNTVFWWYFRSVIEWYG